MPSSENVYFPSTLELSLPKFSLSAVHDMRDLLANMDPEIEAKLLGSQAEFSQLGDPQPFSTVQVSFRSSAFFLRRPARVHR